MLLKNTQTAFMWGRSEEVCKMSLNGNEKLYLIIAFFDKIYDVCEIKYKEIPTGVLEVRSLDSKYLKPEHTDEGIITKYIGPVAYVSLSFYRRPEVSGPRSVHKNNVERILANGLDEDIIKT